jgi:hypothetical protein
MAATGSEDLGDLSRALGGKPGKVRKVKPAAAEKTPISQAYEMKAAEDQAAEMVRVLSKRYSKEEMELWDAETATARYNDLAGIPAETPAATTVAQTAAAPPRVVKPKKVVPTPAVEPAVIPKVPVPDFDVMSTLEAFGKGDPEAKKLISMKLSNLGWRKRPDTREQLIEALTKNLGPKAFGPGGTTTFASGFGGLQDMLGLAAKHPEFASRVALTGAGALMGAVADPFDNPVLSAAAGAGVGILTPSTVSALERLGAPKGAIAAISTPGEAAPKSLGEAAKRLFSHIPDIQRANYLASGNGLMANVFAGPWGSAMMGSLEHLLSGDMRGWKAMKMLGPNNFVKLWGDSLWDAKSTIERAEGHKLSEATTMIGKISAFPGTWMTAGDLASRKILMSAGFTEEEARVMTLTSHPELPFAKFVGEAGRDKVTGQTSGLLQFLFPFRRTPANIMEQGAMRVPILGEIVQSYRKNPDPAKLRVIQQLMGIGVGGVAGGVGSQLDPETAKTARRFVANLGGQYSLPASIGFAMGQASRAGKPMASGVIQQAPYMMPLPTAEPIGEWVKLGGQVITGQRNAKGELDIPRGAYPTFLRPDENQEALGLLKRLLSSASSSKSSSLPVYRRNRG